MVRNQSIIRLLGAFLKVRNSVMARSPNMVSQRPAGCSAPSWLLNTNPGRALLPWLFDTSLSLVDVFRFCFQFALVCPTLFHVLLIPVLALHDSRLHATHAPIPQRANTGSGNAPTALLLLTYFCPSFISHHFRTVPHKLLHLSEEGIAQGAHHRA